jgi:integrase
MPITYDKSKKRWRFKFERVINGQLIRSTKVLPAGFTREDAEKYDKEQTAILYASATGIREKTIDDAVLLYCQEHCPSLKRGDDLIRQLQIEFETYTGKTIAEFPQVASAIRKQPTKAGTKRRKIAHIHAALNYAHKYHNFPKPPVVPSIEVNNERHVYLSRREMLTIAKHSTSIDARAIMRIAFYTGLRQNEILRMSVINNRIVVRDTKNGEAIHALPIHPKIKSAVRRAPFAIDVNALRWQWVMCRKKAGMKQYRFHDLRHSAASEMVNQGIDLYTVGAVLNHKSLTSTKRYAHLRTERLEEALRAIGKSTK